MCARATTQSLMAVKSLMTVKSLMAITPLLAATRCSDNNCSRLSRRAQVTVTSTSKGRHDVECISPISRHDTDYISPCKEIVTRYLCFWRVFTRSAVFVVWFPAV